jgi:hypothetical protein
VLQLVVEQGLLPLWALVVLSADVKQHLLDHVKLWDAERGRVRLDE